MSLLAHLRKEADLIRSGLELLLTYRQDLQSQGKQSCEELRMIVFALQILFENLHLTKEKSILFPALRNAELFQSLPLQTKHNLDLILQTHETLKKYLLELRLSVDEYNYNAKTQVLLSWRIEEFVNYAMLYLEEENEILFSLSEKILAQQEQQNLFLLVQKLDVAEGSEHLLGSHLIFNRLRQKMETA
jgi:hemerythrin-like domain-containing protein